MKYSNLKSNTLSVLYGLALCVAGGTPSAAQQDSKLNFRFEPPTIAVEPICTSRPPDETTKRFWESWDGGSLPNLESALIKRDINRLLHIDGLKWYETAIKMIDRLEERDPSFGGQNALLSRISAMESAGRFQALTKSQMVPELASYDDTLSPRARTILSRLYRDGIGVPRDVTKANELLVSAGYSGNADALLTLSDMYLHDEAPEGWDVPLELAVSMAFGSLVGELNPTICDRTARIAREYHTGNIVQRDVGLAHDWFQFTADLGDPYAAWKVVEYHLEAEGFEKDNKTLLKYLNVAVDAGLPYAQIELGRIYEEGSLVERNYDKALELYQKAASTGERPGLTRVALFLERHADMYPDLQTQRIDMLVALTELEDAPGWAFTRLSQHILETKGRWAGATEAKELLERAAALGDLDGMVSLAELILSDAETSEDFNTAVNILAKAVSVNGGVTPLKELYSAYTCRAEDAPRVSEAQHWQYLEKATATANTHLTAQEVISLTPESNPLEIAVLQSHALYGRPKALASWIKLLEHAEFADPELKEFWLEYSDKYSLVLNALAKLDLELAENREQRLAAFGLMRQEYQRSGPVAALTLAEALLDSRTSTDPERAAAAQQEALTLLAEIAELGYGQAIQLIAGFATDETQRRAIYEKYRETIDRNGDFTALLFAAPYVPEDQRDATMRRARGVMSCDFKNAMLMANTMLEIGDLDGTRHWLDISETMTGDNAWAITNLAKTRFDLDGPETAGMVAAMYERSYAMGDDTAGRELFDLRVRSDLATYDPDRAVVLINEALQSKRVPLLAAYLGRYRKADDATQSQISAQVDIPELYHMAALGGDVYSMRSYGQYLKEKATTPSELVTATGWLRQAAEWGDTTAMAEYGEALAFGLGVDADPENASVWLEQAAAHGSEKAAEINRLLKLSRGSALDG